MLLDQEVQADINQITTIESILDDISMNLDLEQIAGALILDKLCTTTGTLASVSTKIDMAQAGIDSIDMKVNELAGDFQETWTILEALENKVCTVESQACNILSKIEQIDPLELDTVQDKLCTIDSKVDVTCSLINSLADVIFVVDGDLVFFEVNSLNDTLSKVCALDSEVDILDDDIDSLGFGIGISSDDIGTTGFTIDTAGVYFLTENITFSPSSAAAAITINVDDVFLDMKNRAITQGNTT